MPPPINPSAGRHAARPRAISTPTASCRSPRPLAGCRPGLFRGLPDRLSGLPAGLLSRLLTRPISRRLAGRPAGLLARYQHAASALHSPAAAGEDFVDVGRIVRVAFDLIIVGQLFTGLNGPNGLDVDPLLLSRACAVRIAAVVDVARLVTSDTAVDHDLGVDREQKGVIVVRILVLVACIRLIMADTIPEVLDDCRSLADPSGREYSVAVDARVAYFEQGQAARALLHADVVQTAIGAL